MYRRRRQVATGLMGVQTHDDREALTKQLVKATHIKGSDKGPLAGRATEATLLATAGAEHPSSRDVPRWEACLPFTDVKQHTVDEARNAFLFISDLYEEPPSIFGVHDVVTAMNIPAELAVEVSESVEHLEVRVVPISVPGADAGEAGEDGEDGEDGEVEGSRAGSRAVSMVGAVSVQPGAPPLVTAAQIHIRKATRSERSLGLAGALSAVRRGGGVAGSGGGGEEDDEEDESESSSGAGDSDSDDSGNNDTSGLRTMHIISIVPEEDQMGSVELVLVAKDWIGATKERFTLVVEGLLVGDEGKGLRLMGEDELAAMDLDSLQNPNPRQWPWEDIVEWLRDKEYGDSVVAGFEAGAVDGATLLEVRTGEELRIICKKVGRSMQTRLLKDIDDLRDVAEMVELQGEMEERAKQEEAEEEERKAEAEEEEKARVAKMKRQGQIPDRMDSAFLKESDLFDDDGGDDDDGEGKEGKGGDNALDDFSSTDSEWSDDEDDEAAMLAAMKKVPTIFDSSKRRSADVEVFWLSFLLEKLISLHNIHVDNGVFYDLTCTERCDDWLTWLTWLVVDY